MKRQKSLSEEEMTKIFEAPVREWDDEVLDMALATMRQMSKAKEEAASIEFGNALNRAIVTEETGPLKDYLASDKPLSLQHRKALGGYIRTLEKRIASLEKRLGRPRRKPDSDKVSRAERAERNAAQLVAFEKQSWRKQHGRKRVPGHVVDHMIGNAIKAVAAAFEVPVEEIKADNVHNAHKSGRVVVP
jgi:hypothetical protein